MSTNFSDEALIQIEFDEDTPDEDIIEFGRQLEKINIVEAFFELIDDDLEGKNKEPI